VSIVEQLLEKLVERVEFQGETLRAEVAAGLAESRNGQRITGARLAPIYANTLAATTRGRLVGWSVREAGDTLTPPAPAAARVTIYDGRDSSADVLAVIQLGAGAADTQWLGPGGVSFGEAAFVAVTGTVAGSLYFGAVD
jgi:hypothetical protein